MLYLKACPKCRGDIELTSDQYGRYMECLQCAYLIRPKGDRTLEVRKVASTTRAA